MTSTCASALPTQTFLPFETSPPPYQTIYETLPIDPNSTYHVASLGIPTWFQGETVVLTENTTARRGTNRTSPHIIFPPSISNRLYSIPKQHAPYVADQEPIGFSYSEWTHIWEGNHETNLDTYLRIGRGIADNRPIPWTYEYEFKGAPYRLTIDHQRQNDDFPLFEHGHIISFGNCNAFDYRYIIDHCAHVDDNFAYLKVICFNTFQDYYDASSYRPPLILVVPKSYSNTRMHPNLEISPPLPSIPPVTPVKQSRLNRFHSLCQRVLCRKG